MRNLFFLTLCCIFILSSCDDKIKILGEDSSNMRALRAIQKEYEKESGVSLAFRPNSFDIAFEKANQDFVNKSGLYDIIMQYNFSLSSYIENDYVYELDTLLAMVGDDLNSSFEKDLFQEAWVEVGWYYDKTYGKSSDHIIKIGYPFATNTMLLVYNKEMFENPQNKEEYKKRFHKELSVPTDWETFAQIAEFFTNPKSQTYGICMQGDKDSWLYYEYCDFLYGMGGSIFKKKHGWEGDKYTPITITSKEAVEATKLYKRMKAYNKGSYINISATEQVDLIKKGDVAMGIVWSDYLFGFLDKEFSNKFGFAVLPGNHSPIAGGCFYVNKQSKHPVEAIKYILYIMQPEVQVKLALQGLCSPLKSTYNNMDVKKKIKYSDALAKSLERGTYMYEASIESSLVSEIVTKHIQRMWNEDIDVEVTLNNIKKEIEAERNNLYKNR